MRDIVPLGVKTAIFISGSPTVFSFGGLAIENRFCLRLKHKKGKICKKTSGDVSSIQGKLY
ncbi:MAG: hypothetical protein CW691_11155 [Candidatus Bathyarchaeum sp.]|nr:MAG: hypothetical protein CW691_11155 [Candidatus Bathyarchaeum sp.]